MALCGGSFTLRGMVDDPCASVSATITDTNGDVTTIAGEVERSGVLWVENLPLAEGTNWLTLWVTNSAGLTNATSFSVVKSDMTLMVTNISGDLWQPPVNVSGFVSDTTAAIYVNGLQGTNYGDGTWEVDDVPVSASGVASFDVNALPGGGDPAINTNVDKQAEIIMVGYQEAETEQGQEGFPWWNLALHMGYTNRPYARADGQWISPYHGYEDCVNTNDHDGALEDVYNWSPTNDTVLETYNGTPAYYDPIPANWEWTPPPIPGQDQTESEPPPMVHYFADNVHWHYDLGGGGTEDLAVTARTWLKLYTGGKALSGQKNLFCINAGATEYGRPPMDYEPPFCPWWNTPSWDVADKTSIRVLGKYLGADGNLWIALPDNAALDLFIAAPPRHYNAWAGAQKYKLKIQANNSVYSPWLQPDHVVPAATNFWIGQKITFSPVWFPSTPPYYAELSYFHWHLPGNYVNELVTYWTDIYDFSKSCTNYDVNSDLLAQETTSCWYKRDLQATTVSVGMNLLFPNGQNVSIAALGKLDINIPTLVGNKDCKDLNYPNSGWDDPCLYLTHDGGSDSDSILSPINWTTGVYLGGQYGGYSRHWASYRSSLNGDQFGYTQIGTSFREVDGVPGVNNTGNENWLDPNDQFNNKYVGTNPDVNGTYYVQQTDRPANPIGSRQSQVNDTFKDYFQYLPPGNDSISITLGSVEWSWGYNAQYSNSAWNVTPSNLSSGQYQADETFPLWTGSFSGQTQ